MRRSLRRTKTEKRATGKRTVWDYILPNRVYFPPSLYERIRGIASKLADVADDFLGASGGRNTDLSHPMNFIWSKAFDTVERDVNPLFVEMVRDVQKLLGVQELS